MKSFWIQSRDQALLIGLYQRGFLLRDHAWKLYFSECALRRATRRFLALKEHGLIVAHTLPLGAFALGIEGFLPHPGQLAYRLSTSDAAVDLVAGALEIVPAAVRRRLRNAPSYTGHCVAVVCVELALRSYQKPQNYRVQSFHLERDAGHVYEWRPKPDVPWKRAEIRPDALVWIEREGIAQPWFMEADLASQSKAAFLTKLQRFCDYRTTGTYARRFGDAPFRLLIVTTTTTRRDTLVELVRKSDLATVPGVAVTTFNELHHHGLISPIWHIPALGTERNLL